ncbi:hypothetical protein F1728_04760 [Gimesia benthica]|uniref:Reverse transcriptase domain-containing protein n=1 Tax=Gimesia benthica TaxID=2608982 RepID=A0A6I6A9K5_9PLAN|nr:reverse transcriptase domain-containing protein [Gimesia benthica]QGQ22045.1 hypothetical protein F1728_04760 [Gimesia benthica]
MPKPDGGLRELELQCIPDRLIAFRLHRVLMPFFNQSLPGPTRSNWALYAELEQQIETRNQYCIVTDDIANCFPWAPIEPTLECHRQIINNPDLLWLIETVIRGHKGQNRTTGLCQGSRYSPAALEFLLHNHLDTLLSAEYRGSRTLYRYVDNLLIVCNNEHDCRQAIQSAEEHLSERGFQLKHNEGPPEDIRDNTRRKILGVIPRWQNGKLHFTIPEDAFQKLETSLNAATLSSHPLSRVQNVTKDWLSAYGPALVAQTVRDVVNKVINLCRNSGFVEITHRNLSQTAAEAYQRWQELRSTVRTSPDRN